ncbi:MAG: MFS transporter, partial [Pseudobdellovibrio sp.]
MSSSFQKTPGLLRSKKYVLYWVSSLLSNIGTWMQQVAQPWVILSITQSSFYVGLDNFVMNAPSWIFTLWGGVIADRFDRKKIVLVCQTVQFFCVLFLLLALVTNHMQIWLILVSSFLIGMTDSLSMPAFMSIIPSLVTEEELPRAVALNSAQFNLSRVLGPAVAGAVIAVWGASICYGANLISFIPFFLSLYWIYPKTQPGRGAPASLEAPVRFSEFFDLLKDKKVLFPLATIFTSTL